MQQFFTPAGSTVPAVYCRSMAIDHTQAEELAEMLGNFAIELQDQCDAEATLRSIVHSSVGVVPGARWAGISFVEGRKVLPRVPTDPLVAELDEMQTSLDEGPCLDALREHHTVQIVDMDTEDRWPRFARAARARGVHSSLSFQLYVRAETFGALNLYGGEPGGFSDDSLLVGTVLAQHASVAMAGDAAAAQLRTAVGTRDIIGQAKGLLMQRNGVTGLHAFQMLTKASQDTNTKIVDLAQYLVDMHESPLLASPERPTPVP